MNAKKEFLRFTANHEVLCATIHFDKYLMDEEITRINLPVNYTELGYQEFLSKLDRNYDSGYGGQELFGTIWFKDGTWADRGEYDGSEWWQHHIIPEIEDFLLL